MAVDKFSPRSPRSPKSPSPQPTSLQRRSRKRDHAETAEVTETSPLLLRAKSKMRIGDEYQAEIPPMTYEVPNNLVDNTECWNADAISDSEYDEYVKKVQRMASDQYSDAVLQYSLDLLAFHHYQPQVALEKLQLWLAQQPADTTPLGKWNAEDIKTFETQYSLHDRRFALYKTALPHKTTPELVQFYYFWKKSAAFDNLHKQQLRQWVVTNPDTPTDEMVFESFDPPTEPVQPKKQKKVRVATMDFMMPRRGNITCDECKLECDRNSTVRGPYDSILCRVCSNAWRDRFQLLKHSLNMSEYDATPSKRPSKSVLNHKLKHQRRSSNSTGHLRVSQRASIEPPSLRVLFH